MPKHLGRRLVWRWLRDRRFSTYKFRRQHPVGRYVLDFYCEEARLGIELDGSGHGFPEGQSNDRVRDRTLEKSGIKTLRFWNSRILRQKQAIRDTIFRELQERAPHPLPAYTRPGVGGGVRATRRSPYRTRIPPAFAPQAVRLLPLPPGEGRGEGEPERSAGEGNKPRGHPHPNPLPEGEGMRTALGEVPEPTDCSSHTPIAL